MRSNNLIILFVKNIIRSMSDSQIKLLQNWLYALSDALFAFRSEAKGEPLSFRQQHKKDIFDAVDEKVHFRHTFSNETSGFPGFSIEMPRKPGEDFIEETKYFRFKKNENGAYTVLHPAGGSGRRTPAEFENSDTPNHSSFGIKIINYADW